MSNYILWFVFAALFAGLELLSGTFYLLLYGVSCVVGAVAALLGFNWNLQLIIAAICAVGATLWLRRHPIVRPAHGTQSLEIGQRVTVESWKTDTLLRVKYRGAGWDAELAQKVETRPDTLVITGQRGNTLIVSPEPPAH
ncbi:MAG: NfeD family protein [Burkholderiales bacterium]|nr:NfeD family protein [Burkholderiales bacterium]